MELTFTYQPKDYSNYNKDTLSIKRIIKYILKANTITFIILSLIISFCFTVSLFGGIYLKYWAYYLVFIGSFVAAYVLSFCLSIASQFLFGGKIIQRQMKGVAKDVKLTINDDVIIFDNGSIQSVCKWNCVKDIYNKKYNLLIFIADMQALIIPKRVFNSSDEINNWWQYLQNCYNNAQNCLK